MSPSNPQGYPRDAALAARGAATGTFQWEVTSGFEDAGFVDGESIVASRTVLNDNTVMLRAKDESAEIYSVKIRFTYNGVVVFNTWNTTVRTAKTLVPLGDWTGADPVYGYLTEVLYKVKDQVGDDFPPVHIGINEQWTTGVVADFPGMNWRRGDAGGSVLDPTFWADWIGGEAAGYNPEAVAPGSPGENTPVCHWGQRWRVGSSNSGVGVRVQTNTLQKYRGYAQHLNIGP